MRVCECVCVYCTAYCAASTHARARVYTYARRSVYCYCRADFTTAVARRRRPIAFNARSPNGSESHTRVGRADRCADIVCRGTSRGGKYLRFLSTTRPRYASAPCPCPAIFTECGCLPIPIDPGRKRRANRKWRVRNVRNVRIIVRSARTTCDRSPHTSRYERARARRTNAV